jgi:hypothetical protein
LDGETSPRECEIPVGFSASKALTKSNCCFSYDVTITHNDLGYMQKVLPLNKLFRDALTLVL